MSLVVVMIGVLTNNDNLDIAERGMTGPISYQLGAAAASRKVFRPYHE
jgi:hypothetical protein